MGGFHPTLALITSTSARVVITIQLMVGLEIKAPLEFATEVGRLICPLWTEFGSSVRSVGAGGSGRGPRVRVSPGLVGRG